jgi:hypothetical protein
MVEYNIYLISFSRRTRMFCGFGGDAFFSVGKEMACREGDKRRVSETKRFI